MKLTLHGHDDRYAVEQLQLSLFPDGTLRRFHNPKFPEQYIELLPGVLEQKQALFRLMADGAK